MGNTQTRNYCKLFPWGNITPLLFIRKTRYRRGREAVESWSAEYNSSGSTCELELTITNGDCKEEQELVISINDHASNQPNDYVEYKMEVSVKGGLLSGDVTVNGPSSLLRLPQCKFRLAQGGALKSSSFLYGTDTDRKGLVVMSRARTHDDDKLLPYMITVKHYFVSAYYSHGVSLVAKIRSNSDDGGLSFEIDKPSKHPKRELLEMFDDVKVRGCWPDTSSSDWAMELPNQHNNQANANSLINNPGNVYGDGQNKYVMRLKCGGPPLQVNDFKTAKYPDREEHGVFCVRRCITLCVGKRVCAFNITEKSKDNRVYSVNIDVTEESGEGSNNAQTSMWFVRNNRYDVLCSVSTKSSSSYEFCRLNYSVPSQPDIEATGFFCPMTRYGGYFTLEKKKFDGSEVVERMKTTHAFLVGGDETVSVKVKITNDIKVGLRVEVERPVKLTLDYSYRVFEKIEEKMEREIRNDVLSMLRNVTAQPPPSVSDSESDMKRNRDMQEQLSSLLGNNRVRYDKMAYSERTVHKESMFNGDGGKPIFPAL